MPKMLLQWIACITSLPVAMTRVVDLTHTYGPDVLYPPVGKNGSADMFNFTIMHRGYEPSLDAWYVYSVSSP